MTAAASSVRDRAAVDDARRRGARAGRRGRARCQKPPKEKTCIVAPRRMPWTADSATSASSTRSTQFMKDDSPAPGASRAKLARQEGGDLTGTTPGGGRRPTTPLAAIAGHGSSRATALAADAAHGLPRRPAPPTPPAHRRPGRRHRRTGRRRHRPPQAAIRAGRRGAAPVGRRRPRPERPPRPGARWRPGAGGRWPSSSTPAIAGSPGCSSRGRDPALAPVQRERRLRSSTGARAGSFVFAALLYLVLHGVLHLPRRQPSRPDRWGAGDGHRRARRATGQGRSVPPGGWSARLVISAFVVPSCSAPLGHRHALAPAGPDPPGARTTSWPGPSVVVDRSAGAVRKAPA